jgi:hypothetical protein
LSGFRCSQYIVAFEHPKKAHKPIEDTDFEIVTEVKPEQYLKAPSPMDVTLLGIFIEVKPLQLEKASSSIEVTLSGSESSLS